MSHTRVIATGIICLAFIGSAFVYSKKSYLFEQLPGQNTPEVTAHDVSNQNLAGVGTDWKKTLEHFMQASTSPIAIITDASLDRSSPDDTSLTAQLSKQFFAGYMAAKQQGVAITPDTALQIANQSLANVSIPSTAKQYTVTDIHISSDTSESAKKIYGLALYTALKNNSPKSNQAELDIVSKAIASNSETDMKALDSIISGYSGLIRDTLKITVPQDAIGLDLVYINTLSAVLSDSQAMRNLFTDPMTGYIAFSAYQHDIEKLQVTVEKMNVYFGEKPTLSGQ